VMEALPNDRTANLGRVRVVRADPRDPLVIYVNLSEMFDGDSTYNVQLRERDIVYVPPTMMAQLGYFISDLIFPVTEVFKNLGGAFFLFGGNRAYGRRGRGGANNNIF